MAIEFKDRVKDTTTTTGTGNITLSGSAPAGFVTFGSAYSTGSTHQFYYCITDGTNWEVGTGHLSASTTLVRDTVLASSNSNAAVSFPSGSKDVFVTVPSAWFAAPVANMTGDSGSGGAAGLVPAPGAGDAAAGKFLKADGTFAVPAGGGGGASAIDDLTDVDTSTTAPDTNPLLVWDGANWVPSNAGVGISFFTPDGVQVFIADVVEIGPGAAKIFLNGGYSYLGDADGNGNGTFLLVSDNDQTVSVNAPNGLILNGSPVGSTQVVDKSANFSITAADSGKLFNITASGKTGTIDADLPIGFQFSINLSGIAAFIVASSGGVDVIDHNGDESTGAYTTASRGVTTFTKVAANHWGNSQVSLWGEA